MPIRTAIVGCGQISNEHFSFFERWNQGDFKGVPQVDLVGVCDLSPAVGAFHADKFGAHASYVDFDTMLVESNPEVIHVLTPPMTHYDLSAKAIDVGCHVVTEKPICSSSVEVIKLMKLADDAGVKLVESQNYRFNDEVLAITEMIRSGKLGAVTQVEVRICVDITSKQSRFVDLNVGHPANALPGGPVTDFLPHLSYLALGLAGVDRFNEVKATWANMSGTSVFEFDDMDAICVGETDQGPVRARLSFSSVTHPESFSVNVRGTEASVETDLFQPYLRVDSQRSVAQLSSVVNHVSNGVSMARSGVSNLGHKVLQKSPYHGLRRMLAELYRSIDAKSQPPITPADVVGSVVLVEDLVKQQNGNPS